MCSMFCYFPCLLNHAMCCTPKPLKIQIMITFYFCLPFHWSHVVLPMIASIQRVCIMFHIQFASSSYLIAFPKFAATPRRPRLQVDLLWLRGVNNRSLNLGCQPQGRWALNLKHPTAWLPKMSNCMSVGASIAPLGNQRSRHQGN